MNADQQILTQLAKEYREVAFAPVNEERRALWKALNGLRECRPLIMMDQLPWHELDVDGDLKLRCRDADARIVEDALRKQLYQAKYFPADKVFEPYLELPKTIEGYHHGVVRREVTLAADEKNDVVSHSYVSQLSSESDLEKALGKGQRNGVGDTAGAPDRRAHVPLRYLGRPCGGDRDG